MKVRTRVGIGDVQPGDVVDLSEGEAEQLLRDGWADEVDQRTKPVENLNPDKEKK